MKILLKIIILSALVHAKNIHAETSVKKTFSATGTCFKLVQISSGKVLEEVNPKICSQRFSPNSTFKIPLSLMAFEKGILNNEDHFIKWDGTQYDRKELNQNQTPATWMDRSVVWVSKWITPQLTDLAIKTFLKDFDYGNQDFSGGITKAWLDSSLKVSPDEQISFMKKFWQETLPLSKSTFEKTKKIIFIKKLNPKNELYGKTGTGCLKEGCDKHPGLMQGWFVGVVKSESDAYVFAAYTADTKKESDPAGPRVRKLVTLFLAEMNLK